MYIIALLTYSDMGHLTICPTNPRLSSKICPWQPPFPTCEYQSCRPLHVAQNRAGPGFFVCLFKSLSSGASIDVFFLLLRLPWSRFNDSEDSQSPHTYFRLASLVQSRLTRALLGRERSIIPLEDKLTGACITFNRPR